MSEISKEKEKQFKFRLRYEQEMEADKKVSGSDSVAVDTSEDTPKQSVGEQLSNDAPYLAGSALQAIPGPVGTIASVAGSAAEQPMAGAIAGIPGMKVAEGANISATIKSFFQKKEAKELFPGTGLTRAKTPSGQIAQAAIDLVGPFISAKVQGKMNDVIGQRILKKMTTLEAPELKKLKSANNDSFVTQKMLNETASANAIDDLKSEAMALKITNGAKINSINNEEFPKAADAVTAKARPLAMQFWRELIKDFGADYNKAKAGVKITPEQELNALNNAASESGIFRKLESATPLSPAENKLMKMIESAQERFSSELNVARPLDHFDNEINVMVKDHGGENVVTNIRKNVSDLLEPFKAVRAKYADRYRLKNEMFKVFQPFNRSGEFDTTSGTNLFKRVFNGKANPDEARLVQEIGKRDPKLLNELHSLRLKKADLVKSIEDADLSYKNKSLSIVEEASQANYDASIDTFNENNRLDALIRKATRNDNIKKIVGTAALAGTVGSLGANLVSAVFSKPNNTNNYGG